VVPFTSIKSRTPDLDDRFDIGAIVINLTGRGNHSRNMKFTGTIMQTAMIFHEVNVSLYDALETMTEIEAGRVPLVVLPLIPLMQNGENADVIQRWLAMAATAKVDARRNSLALMARIFAEASDCAPTWNKAMEGWNMQRSLVWEQLERDVMKSVQVKILADQEKLREKILIRRKFGRKRWLVHWLRF